jgi:LmbE family N-acetylglucosaminyl deacetylase
VTVTRRQLLAGMAAAAAGLAGVFPVTQATGRSIIFISPHPDDETLAMGAAIAQHLAAGRQVHALALTAGTATRVRGELNGDAIAPWWGVRHDPAAEGYAPLTTAAIGQARLREWHAALDQLGVPQANRHEAGLQDGAVTVEGAMAAIRAVADGLPNTGLWTTSWVADRHPDHLAAGQAVRRLGQLDPIRWWDRRYTVLPTYWADPIRYPAPGRAWLLPADTTQRRKAINACRCYGAWQPRSGAYAVGMHSVDALFTKVMADPRCMVHRD